MSRNSSLSSQPYNNQLYFIRGLGLLLLFTFFFQRNHLKLGHTPPQHTFNAGWQNNEKSNAECRGKKSNNIMNYSFVSIQTCTLHFILVGLLFCPTKLLFFLFVEKPRVVCSAIWSCK